MSIERQDDHRDELEQRLDGDAVAERLEVLGIDPEGVEGVREAMERTRLALVEAFERRDEELDELFDIAA